MSKKLNLIVGSWINLDTTLQKKVANGLCSNMQTKTVLEALVRRLRFCLIFLINCMNINCAWKKYSLSLSHGLTLLLTLGNVEITYFQSLDHCS